MPGPTRMRADTHSDPSDLSGGQGSGGGAYVWSHSFVLACSGNVVQIATTPAPSKQSLRRQGQRRCQRSMSQRIPVHVVVGQIQAFAQRFMDSSHLVQGIQTADSMRVTETHDLSVGSSQVKALLTQSIDRDRLGPVSILNLKSLGKITTSNSTFLDRQRWLSAESVQKADRRRRAWFRGAGGETTPNHCCRTALAQRTPPSCSPRSAVIRRGTAERTCETRVTRRSSSLGHRHG